MFIEGAKGDLGNFEFIRPLFLMDKFCVSSLGCIFQIDCLLLCLIYLSDLFQKQTSFFLKKAVNFEIILTAYSLIFLYHSPQKILFQLSLIGRRSEENYAIHEQPAAEIFI